MRHAMLSERNQTVAHKSASDRARRLVLRPSEYGAHCDPGFAALYAVYDDSRLASITDDRRLLEAALRHGSGMKIEEAV